jgi:hypothetical protein
MKAKTPTRPATQAMEGIISRNVNDDLPISSAIVGITLLGDVEDVLAVIRTAFLLARSLKAPLSLNLFERDILPNKAGDISSSTLVSELLDSIGVQLRGFAASAFTMEVSVVAASFVCAGSVTMSVHNANPVPGRQQT